MAVLKVTYSKKRDSDLWQDFRSGDRDAFDHIFYTYIKSLINYCRKFSTNNDLIDDCIQDMFLELWVKRERLGDTDSIRGYLYKTIRRKILHEVRNQSLSRIEEFKDGESVSFDALLDTGFLSDMSSNPNIIIETLTPMQKEVIYLKYYNGLTIEEISEILNLSKKSTYNYLSKALMKFRKYYKGT